MRTRLREILKLSNVKIITDDTYMSELEETQKLVKKWHETHKSNDNYFGFKVKFFVERFGVDELKRCVDHLESQKNLMYEKEDILREAKKYDRT